jgi:peptidoglycan-associated lipoprotein
MKQRPPMRRTASQEGDGIMRLRKSKVVLKYTALAACAIVTVACASSAARQNASLSSDASLVSTAPEGGANVQAGSEEEFIVNVGRRTFFSEGSAALDETAKVTLDKQALWLNEHPQWKVKLQGFADDPGTPSEQKALSQKRADAVRDYLAARGVSTARMKAKGYGRDRLVGDCADIECKAQNRRVITNPQDEPES